MIHYGRIKVIKEDDNPLRSLCICPHCGSEVIYGNMMMYNGTHGCPKCIRELNKTIDFDRNNQYEEYVRKSNEHEYEPYKYREE